MLMDVIKARHSIRKYTAQQISRKDLETILEAGNYAPNAGGGQRSMMVAVHDRELTHKIGLLNMSRFDRSTLARTRNQRQTRRLSGRLGLSMIMIP